DVRYGLRSLRHSPSFAVVTVLSLALGIGANTAIFSLIDTLLLKTLPIEDPERLLVVTRAPERAPEVTSSYALFAEVRRRALEVFSDVAAWHIEPTFVRFDADVERVLVARASGEFYRTLGVRPLLGRTLEPEDDRRAAAFCVLSYGAWSSRFGGSPDAL